MPQLSIFNTFKDRTVYDTPISTVNICYVDNDMVDNNNIIITCAIIISQLLNVERLKAEPGRR